MLNVIGYAYLMIIDDFVFSPCFLSCVNDNFHLI